MRSSTFISAAKRPRGTGKAPRFGLAALLAAAIGLAGCSGLETEAVYPDNPPGRDKNRGTPVYDNEKRQTVFGEGGFDLFGLGDKKDNPGGGGSGIAVNSFLWRASLDTVAFMPLSSADPFGGVIITDWYSPPEVPSERYKMSVYILGRELRADGVKVAVFRERAAGQGNWVATPVSSDTSTSLENQILTRARQLRVASTQAR